jgi:hypothetical protein
MIWISRGHGGWALRFPLVLVLLLCLAKSQFGVPSTDPKIVRWGLIALGMVFGLIMTGVGFYLNRGSGCWAIDSATGLQYFDKSARHSLYFIPMQYWGLFYCALALAAAVANH